MDIQQLRAFIAVADAGGVTPAALRLNLSQPAVSRQIQGLEATLGVRLVERHGRRVRLSAAGEALLARGRAILAEVEAMHERAAALGSGTAGRIRIGATPPMIEAVLAAFLGAWRARHPGIEVHITEDGGASLADRLERGELHLAYVPAGDARFTGRLLYPVHVVAALPRGSDLAGAGWLDIARLAGRPLLVLQRGFGSREWFETACAAAGQAPSVLLESASPNAVLALAEAGYGIGILPSATPVARDAVSLVALTSHGAPIGRWTMLAWSARRRLPPHAVAFAEALATHAADRFPGRAVVATAPPIPRPAETSPH